MTITWEDLSVAVKRKDTARIARRLPEIERCMRSEPRLTRTRVEQEILHGRKLVLKPCPFPYDVEGYHYILWVRDRISHAQAWKTLVGRVPAPFLVYENPPHMRSVPHTQHYHVFTRVPLERR